MLISTLLVVVFTAATATATATASASATVVEMTTVDSTGAYSSDSVSYSLTQQSDGVLVEFE